jgi:hypothetical protein
VSTFAPRLDVLPASQRDLWPELSRIRDQFILYGGTALALRLGHRASDDFDFFSFQPFDMESLRHSVPWIREAEILQAQPNTLTILHQGQRGRVKVSFFGGLTFSTIAAPDSTTDGKPPDKPAPAGRRPAPEWCERWGIPASSPRADQSRRWCN